MSTLIQKARKGSRDAMISLYDNNKERVLFICSLLMENRTTACNAASYAFRHVWEAVLSGEIDSEEDFERAVIHKAVSYCKTSILRHDPKAFKIPNNKNFIGNYQKENMIWEKDPCWFITWNLPYFQRFAYILRAVLGYDANEIAAVLKTRADVVLLALEQEQNNIDRIFSYYDQQDYRWTAEEYHRELFELRESVSVPGGVNTTVTLGIRSVCDPILGKAKKKRNRILMCVGIGLLSLCLIAFAVWGIYKAMADDTEGTEDTATEAADDGDEDEAASVIYTTEYTATHYADIVVEGYGTITVALDANQAPITVENFVNLANEGFYDGLTFHRIVEDFMMQGGDPNGDGTGGNTDEDGNEINIEGEFYYNGSDNMLSHVRGAISMARGDDYDSASSQFFIVHTDTYLSSLDGLYAVFGYVTEGMDIVDALCEATYTVDEYETIDAEEQPVITSITIRTVDTDTETDTDTDTDTDTETESDND